MLEKTGPTDVILTVAVCVAGRVLNSTAWKRFAQKWAQIYIINLQDRVGHSGSGFPGGPRTPVSDFQPPYFPPPFGGQQPTAQEVFAAAQAPHLAAAAAATADPYTNSALHNFQTSQVRF